MSYELGRWGPLIPTLQRPGQEAHKEAGLGYITKPGGKENKTVNYAWCW